MKFPGRNVRHILHSTVIAFVIAYQFPRDAAGQSLASDQVDGPFMTIYARSIASVLGACEQIFEKVDRPDLAKSLDQRLSRYNGFSGIDQEKPLGMAWTWGTKVRPHVVFLPVTDVDALMSTVTFGVVDYYPTGPDTYEINKVGDPYQVCVRRDYAYIAESVLTIDAANNTIDQAGRRLRNRYDLAIHFDLQQIPKSVKLEYVRLLNQYVKPALQAQDGEEHFSAQLRRGLGMLVLQVIERVVMDTSAVTLGVVLDPETAGIHVEVIAEATPASTLALALNSTSSIGSSTDVDRDSDAIADVAIHVPTQGEIERLVGETDSVSRRGLLQARLLLVGDSTEGRSLIVALRGAEVKALNAALPRILVALEQSRQIEHVLEAFASYEKVVFHRLTPIGLPELMTSWITASPELVIGQGDSHLWIGIGSESALREKLEDDIDRVSSAEGNTTRGPLVLGRAQMRTTPEFIASNILIPNMNEARVREELDKGKDGIDLKVELINNGLKLSIDFETGFTCLIGRDWIRQVEALNRN